MWVIKMNKFGIVFGTLFTFFGGLLTSYKSNEITKITYEIQADNFFDLRKVKEKMLVDYQKLFQINIKKTHENILSNLDNFLYEDNYEVSYENYHLLIKTGIKSNYKLKGYLYYEDKTEVDKRYFFGDLF